MTPCRLCTYAHTPDLVRAVDRFHLGGPTGYRAVTLDAPLRATRAEAMADACVVEGFKCIAIEREADYLPLIVQRLTKPMQTALELGGTA